MKQHFLVLSFLLLVGMVYGESQVSIVNMDHPIVMEEYDEIAVLESQDDIIYIFFTKNGYLKLMVTHNNGASTTHEMIDFGPYNLNNIRDLKVIDLSSKLNLYFIAEDSLGDGIYTFDLSNSSSNEPYEINRLDFDLASGYISKYVIKNNIHYDSTVYYLKNTIFYVSWQKFNKGAKEFKSISGPTGGATQFKLNSNIKDNAEGEYGIYLINKQANIEIYFFSFHDNLLFTELVDQVDYIEIEEIILYSNFTDKFKIHYLKEGSLKSVYFENETINIPISNAPPIIFKDLKLIVNRDYDYYLYLNSSDYTSPYFLSFPSLQETVYNKIVVNLSKNDYILPYIFNDQIEIYSVIRNPKLITRISLNLADLTIKEEVVGLKITPEVKIIDSYIIENESDVPYIFTLFTEKGKTYLCTFYHVFLGSKSVPLKLFNYEFNNKSIDNLKLDFRGIFYTVTNDNRTTLFDYNNVAVFQSSSFLEIVEHHSSKIIPVIENHNLMFTKEVE